jgi:hypothetical protein
MRGLAEEQMQIRATLAQINRANFDVSAANISVPSQVCRTTNTTNTPRDIQFGARLAF